MMTTCPIPSALLRSFPGDTEGRAMYRNVANAAAAQQLAYEKRWVRLRALTKDDLSEQECLGLILAATDNPEITPIVLQIEAALTDHTTKDDE